MVGSGTIILSACVAVEAEDKMLWIGFRKCRRGRAASVQQDSPSSNTVAVSAEARMVASCIPYRGFGLDQARLRRLRVSVKVPCEGAATDVRRHLGQTKWNHERFWRERPPYDAAGNVIKQSQTPCAPRPVRRPERDLYEFKHVSLNEQR